MNKYTVVVETIYTDTVEVEAATELEAEAKAREIDLRERANIESEARVEIIAVKHIPHTPF